MASFVNKIADKVTNATGSLVGRENLTKITNSLNKSLYSQVKYRPLLKTDNVVQLISRQTLRPLQIVRSADNPMQLILTADGQIGDEFINSHFKLFINSRNQHIAFQNFNNFIAVSQNRIPGVMTIEDQNLLNINKKNLIYNIEFRLHEILGSEEHFALESTYSAGNYLSISAKNTISFIKNKSDKSAHFQLHLIQEANNGQQGQAASGSNTAAAGASASATEVVEQPNPFYDSQKEQEMLQVDNHVSDDNRSIPQNDVPPNYTSLYPQLPR